MNDQQDKQYLALELTRIAYPPTLETCGAKLEEIYKAYEYFLKQTMEMTDEIETVTSLKTEVERLRKENEKLKSNNRDILEPFVSYLIEVLDNHRGNMEPYVYNQLVQICKAKMQ